MKASQVRQTFVDFFKDRGHSQIHSASLVPDNDPTLLFTNAGMVQFKNRFTGAEKDDISRATTSQKCVRAGGKHNDLDEVGKTARHHTFFEMLGNFSFGDYFKREAIEHAWALLVDVYKMDPKRLIVTVHRGDTSMDVGADDEARALWTQTTGFSNDRILGLGSNENFWMMGETGPMGPCSEIHYYLGEGEPKLPPADESDPLWNDWLEIWNLVFMQYERREAGGKLHALPAPSIDTGAGLERVTAVLQGVQSNYDTDLFQPLLRKAADIAGVRYGKDPNVDTSIRVIADHARATSFLVADGVFPDKTNREYVLRRIFRRAVRHGKLIGIDEPFMHKVCAVVVDEMEDAFPELRVRSAIIREIALEEEAQFRRTMDRGLAMLAQEFKTSDEKKVITGDTVFQLYDTFGFPDDLTEIIATENNFEIDRPGFERSMEEAKNRSRLASGTTQAGKDQLRSMVEGLPATEFVGYSEMRAEAQVLALAKDGRGTQSVIAPAEVAIVFDKTPFYGESGGQVGDQGALLRSDKGDTKIAIHDTQKPDGETIVHLGTLQTGSLKVGETYQMSVDEPRRSAIRANHSATHLLNFALRKFLGDHVSQKGSLVDAERLRFDFSHFSPMSDDELRAVESFVNQEIRSNTPAQTSVLPIEEAKKRGAVAMFGEKYGKTVRVVNLGESSLEFCGGTHVSRTGDIGLFKILSEGGVAQGVRRIEAVTGASALGHVHRLEKELLQAGQRLRCAPFEVSTKIDKVQSTQKSLEKEVGELKRAIASGGSRDLMSEVQSVDGVQVLATQTDMDDVKALRETGDRLRDKLGSGIIVLCGVGAEKVSLVTMVSKDLTSKFHAGKLLGPIAKIVGGKGGGRPDMAQGGGNDPSKVQEALRYAIEAIRSIAAQA